MNIKNRVVNRIAANEKFGVICAKCLDIDKLTRSTNDFGFRQLVERITDELAIFRGDWIMQDGRLIFKIGDENINFPPRIFRRKQEDVFISIKNNLVNWGVDIEHALYTNYISNGKGLIGILDQPKYPEDQIVKILNNDEDAHFTKTIDSFKYLDKTVVNKEVEKEKEELKEKIKNSLRVIDNNLSQAKTSQEIRDFYLHDVIDLYKHLDKEYLKSIIQEISIVDLQSLKKIYNALEGVEIEDFKLGCFKSNREFEVRTIYKGIIEILENCQIDVKKLHELLDDINSCMNDIKFDD